MEEFPGGLFLELDLGKVILLFPIQLAGSSQRGVLREGLVKEKAVVDLDLIAFPVVGVA